MSIGTWSYLALVILAFLALFIAYWKHKTSLLFVALFAFSGVTLFFDYIIYVWGKAYVYHPDFISGKYDSYLGAIINSYILSSFGLLYISLRGNWIWTIVMASFFGGVELLFEYLGIFQANWWRTWYTFFILTPYFLIVRVWWNHLHKRGRRWLRFGTIFAVFYSLYIQSSIVLYAVLKIRTFHVEWIEQLNRDSTAFNSVTAIIFGSLLTYISSAKVFKYWNFILMIGYFVYDLLLKKIGIVRTDQFVLDTILSFMTLFLPLLFVRYAVNKIEGNQIGPAN